MIVEKKDDGAHITDFVISCRVANKKIEPSVVNYLAHIYQDKIYFHYKKTTLNGPMHKVIEELEMETVLNSKDFLIFLHSYKESYNNVVSIKI